MCGLCGVSFFSDSKIEKFKKLGEKLNLNLRHRGPDKEGFIYNKIGGNNLLFHQRLSILEISDKGSQPMISKNDNFIICFNGEIYNHLELREKLDKTQKILWTGNSDTETLLESFSLIGIKETIDLIEGMYAFALIDRRASTIYLGRDLFGEKPLFYYNNNQEIIFSSEVHNVNKDFFEINQKAVNQYLHYNYVPNSNCIYKKWKKVNPGEIIVFNKDCKKKVFYNFKKKLNKDISKKLNFRTNNLENKFDKIFNKVIEDILVADVNVGVFLSGGVDSSLVTCYAKHHDNNLNTFSIGIKNNQDYDESNQAEKISKHLKTNHETFFVDNKEIIENLENTILSYDEPFADSSKILTYILSKKVKKKIKVALTGDGADELFGGYNRHIVAFYIKRLSKLFGKDIINDSFFKKSSTIFFPLMKILMSQFFAYSESKSSKLKSILNYENSEDLIDRIISNKNEYDKLKFEYLDHTNLDKINIKFHDNFFDTILNCDLENYLTDDILVKVDRASMKNSLETRAPFLNKNVFIFSQQLNISEKVNFFKGKYFLRKVLKRFLTQNLISNKKRGFSYPISNFFCDESNRKWIEDIFLVKNTNNIKLISSENISKIFDIHKERKYDYSKILWSNLVLRLWLKKKGFIY
jgi:asparagine synthase (glutamine-hydrolysing)